MSIPWLNPGTQAGRITCGTRTPQCIGKTAGLLIREANPKELGGTGRGKGRFLLFHWPLLFSQIFPTTFTNAYRLAFGEGEGLSPLLKGKHFVLHAVCTSKWMLF